MAVSVFRIWGLRSPQIKIVGQGEPSSTIEITIRIQACCFFRKQALDPRRSQLAKIG